MSRRHDILRPILLIEAHAQAEAARRRGSNPESVPLGLVERIVRKVSSPANPWGIDWDRLKPTDRLADVGTRQNLAGFVYRAYQRSLQRQQRRRCPEGWDRPDTSRPYISHEDALASLHQFCVDETDDGIIDLLAAGWSRAEVARSLKICEGTISRRLAAINARRRAETPAVRKMTDQSGDEVVSHVRGDDGENLDNLARLRAKRQARTAL